MLVLHGNRIGVSGGVELGKLLGANARLQEVLLWGNTLGCEGLRFRVRANPNQSTNPTPNPNPNPNQV